MNIDLCPECGSALAGRAPFGVCTLCGRREKPRYGKSRGSVEQILRADLGPVWGGARDWRAGYTQPGPATLDPRRL